MSLLSWLADRLILCPSTHPVESERGRQVFIETANGRVEAWVLRHERRKTKAPAKLVVVKFPGTAGRAERGGPHPAEVLPDVSAEIWTINNLGYGGSDGPATIKSFPSTATSVFEFISNRYPGQPILVVGNSLGCESALYLGATQNVGGLFLRNPPPIAQMIRTRAKYSWWNFGLSRWIASEVPLDLDALANACVAEAPCLLVQSEMDRVVPVRYQNMIWDNYAGPKRFFRIDGADHHDLVAEHQQQAYFESLTWLLEQMYSD